MNHLLQAITKLDGPYPGYVNVSRDENGIVLTVRGDPTKRDGCYVCGYSSDKGKPGRCTPGDEHCNNYCNMAPNKGPMQPHPLPCVQTIEAPTAVVRLSEAEWAEITNRDAA